MKGGIQPQCRPWMDFVQQYRAEHPEMIYKDVLHNAGIEYRKITGKKKGQKSVKRGGKKGKGIVSDWLYEKALPFVFNIYKKSVLRGLKK